MKLFIPEVATQIRNDYETGKTLAELAKNYETDSQVVREAVVEAGGSIRAKGKQAK